MNNSVGNTGQIVAIRRGNATVATSEAIISDRSNILCVFTLMVPDVRNGQQPNAILGLIISGTVGVTGEQETAIQALHDIAVNKPSNKFNQTGRLAMADGQVIEGTFSLGNANFGATLYSAQILLPVVDFNDRANRAARKDAMMRLRLTDIERVTVEGQTVDLSALGYHTAHHINDLCRALLKRGVDPDLLGGEPAGK